MRISESVRSYLDDFSALFAEEHGRKRSIEDCFVLTRKLLVQRCAPLFGILAVAIVTHAQITGIYSSPLALIITSSAAMLLLIAPLLPRIGLTYEVIGFLLSIVIGTGLFVDAWASGGVTAPVMPILCVIPVLAAFFSGPRTALATAFYISMLIVGLTYSPGTIAVDRSLSPEAAAFLASVAESRAFVFALVAEWAALLLVLSFYYLVARIGEGVISERDRAGAEAASINSFLATLSHDLRTPLNAIIGLSGILKDERAPTDLSAAREHAGLINRSGQHMLGMLNDMLLFGKMDAKEVTLDAAPCNLAEIARAQVEMLRVKAAERGQTVELNVGSVPHRVTCDGQKIARLIGNLVGNAIKYSPTNAKVSLSLAQSGEQVSIEVADKGRGMSAGEIKTALRPFGQVEDNSAANPAEKGVGLGLNICQEIAALHGGTFHIESRKGAGTRVTVTLPVAEPARMSA